MTADIYCRPERVIRVGEEASGASIEGGDNTGISAERGKIIDVKVNVPRIILIILSSISLMRGPAGFIY